MNTALMTPLLRAALFAFATASSASVWAGVTVQDPWVRPTVAQQTSTGAFMQIKSDQATRLVEVSSPIAKTAQVHEMSMSGDVMKMRAVKDLAIPAGKTVELKPGAYHIMLLDLTAQVKAGDTVPLKLVFEGADKKRETVEVKAAARAPAAAGSGAGSGAASGMPDHEHMHHHMD